MPSSALCFYIPLTGTGHPILKTRSVEASAIRSTLQRAFYEFFENMLRVYINLKQLSTEKLNKKKAVVRKPQPLARFAKILEQTPISASTFFHHSRIPHIHANLNRGRQ